MALDSNNPAIYKQLYRAAKAKLKLRIKITVVQRPTLMAPVRKIMDEQQVGPEPLSLPTPPKTSPASRHSYLDTVLSTPREQDDQARQPESFTMPAVSAPAPERPVAVMSLDNATNATLATPAKTSPSKTAKTDTVAKVSPSKGGSLRCGQDYLSGAFCIDCNKCGRSIPDEHYHCGICDDGDFDLCSSCIVADVSCDGEGHWLIKRRIQNGLLVSSVTETIAPKKWQDNKALESEKENTHTAQYAPRTCNSCINGEETGMMFGWQLLLTRLQRFLAKSLSLARIALTTICAWRASLLATMDITLHMGSYQCLPIPPRSARVFSHCVNRGVVPRMQRSAMVVTRRVNHLPCR